MCIDFSLQKRAAHFAPYHLSVRVSVCGEKFNCFIPIAVVVVGWFCFPLS